MSGETNLETIQDPAHKEYLDSVDLRSNDLARMVLEMRTQLVSDMATHGGLSIKVSATPEDDAEFARIVFMKDTIDLLFIDPVLRESLDDFMKSPDTTIEMADDAVEAIREGQKECTRQESGQGVNEAILFTPLLTPHQDYPDVVFVVSTHKEFDYAVVTEEELSAEIKELIKVTDGAVMFFLSQQAE